MCKVVSLAVLFGMYALPALAAPETYKNVPVVDANCSTKVAADPDAHTRECALKCQASGYGIVTKDHQFLKFDSAGNTKVVEALKASNKKDHLHADVTGELKGDMLEVTSVNLL